jgi:hypothetical protein
MDEREWLQSLRVDSEVAVFHSGSFYGRYSFSKVSRETAQYLIVDGYRYRKQDGREAGHPYSSRLVEPTPELKAEEAAKNRHLQLQQKIGAVRWRDLPLETLEAVCEVLEAKAQAA